jgi:SAM-dependent methyltransferase
MTRCPTCNSPSHLAMRLAHTSVWKCSGLECGLRFANPQLGAEALSQAYADYYYPAQSKGACIRYEGTPEALLQQFYSQLQGRIGPLRGMRMLDYGCGNGALLRVGQQFGLTAIGIERDVNARRVAASIPEMLVYEDFAGLCKAAPLEQFDLIILWNVIEHLRCPWSDLRQLRGLLAPGGYVVLSTMNIRCLRARLERKQWENYQNPTHFYYFDRKSLRRVLNAGGFRDPWEWKMGFEYPHHGMLRKLAYKAASWLGVSDGLVFVCPDRSVGPEQTAQSFTNNSNAAFVETFR